MQKFGIGIYSEKNSPLEKIVRAEHDNPEAWIRKVNSILERLKLPCTIRKMDVGDFRSAPLLPQDPHGAAETINVLLLLKKSAY